jgi:predicted signal transduction protein with EAL and GGDEF domain
MVALDEFWPRRVDAILLITTEIVAAIVVSAFLTSVVIALRVSVACMTLTEGELWQIILSISAAPTVLVGWIIAVRIRQTLTRIELKHEEVVSSARIDGLTGLLNRPGFDAVAAEAFEETRRSGQPVSALVCDIDGFRNLNDRYGHEGWRPRSQKSRRGARRVDRTPHCNTGTTWWRRVCDPFARH